MIRIYSVNRLAIVRRIFHATTAPAMTGAHIHTPNASRTILSENGGYTTVEGEKIRMDVGDVILTPPHHWSRMRSSRLCWVREGQQTSFAASSPNLDQTSFTTSEIVTELSLPGRPVVG